MDAVFNCPNSCFQNFLPQYRFWISDLCDGRNIDDIYRISLRDLEKIEPLREAHFGFTIPCAINKKRLYYRRIIDNEAGKFLNCLLAKPEGESMGNCILKCQNRLWTLLERTSRIYFDQKLYPCKYLPATQDLVRLYPEADDAWVFDYLRHQLICLWMELQEDYSRYFMDELYSEDDLFDKWFCQVSTKRITRNPLQQEAINTGFHGFRARKEDFRPIDKGVVSYGNLIKNPELFAHVEENLFHSGFIQSDYRFTDTYGRLTDFSMVVYQLYLKNYFNERIHPGNKKIGLRDVRRFFEHRYQVNIYRPFSRISACNKEAISYKGKYYWLDQLKACRKDTVVASVAV